MSQVVGQVYKSRIPTLGDDASIQEALRVYHYGVDNYSTQTIPDDSIEGNFRSIDSRVSLIESSITTFGNDFLRRVSATSAPNIITSQNTSTVPLVVRAIVSQTSSLQQWQNSSNSVVSSITTGGSFSTIGYLSIGSITPSSSIGLSVLVANSSHKGIVIRPSASQVNNMLEVQNSTGNSVSWISSDGTIYSRGAEVQTSHPFMLMGC